MIRESRKIVVTGANGFVGSNLVLRLQEQGHQVSALTRATPQDQAQSDLAAADTIFHLAGVHRCRDEYEFLRSNRDYSAWLVEAVAMGARRPLIIYSSSLKAVEESPYGRSKRAGEEILLKLAATGGASVSIWRLPNLCGKWSRPNYNSVIATFCHNAARRLPLPIEHPEAILSLVYVDDLVDQWLELITARPQTSGFWEPARVYQTSVGEVARLIQCFADCRARGEVCEVGSGLSRALYASFIAALPLAAASYLPNVRPDARGSFVEVLKTRASGQFSYLTARPGVTRGGHYHHSKVEKFLVAHGTGRFRFKHALSGERFELVGKGCEPLVIEALPGWAHDITNVGDDELVVLIWANERFDPERPDTHPMAL